MEIKEDYEEPNRSYWPPPLPGNPDFSFCVIFRSSWVFLQFVLYIYLTYCWQNPSLVAHIKAEAAQFSSDWEQFLLMDPTAAENRYRSRNYVIAWMRDDEWSPESNHI
jgi:hypothetical protein